MRLLIQPVFLIYFSLQLVQNVDSYNYLVVAPTFGYSHLKFMNKMADTLADGGHNVTVLQIYVYEHFGTIRMTKNKNVELHDYHNLESVPSNEKSASAFDFMWDSEIVNSPLSAAIAPSMLLFPEFEPMCSVVLKDKKLHEWILSKKFDAMISETFDFCGLFLGDHLKLKLIPVFSAVKMWAVEKVIGEPSLLNYYPAPKSKYGPDQTVFDRVREIVYINSWYYAFALLFDKQYIQASEILNGDVRHWQEILSTATFHLTNSNPYLGFPAPTIPKVVQIGGFTIDPPKHHILEKEYDEILNLRKSNVLISFGTVVQSADMPDRFKAGVIKMFHDTPETTFIWKYEVNDEDLKKRLPENVFLQNWIPQPALLADPRIDLFVTHAGLGSTMEVAHSGKPALLIPIFADQIVNAESLGRHNGSIVYSKYDLEDSEKLRSTIQQIISNKEYEETSIRLAEMLRSQPIDPKDSLLKHCEFVVKFGRVPAFEPYNLKYNFIQYYLLDAFAIIFAICGIVLFIFYRITRSVIRRLFVNGKKKTE